MDGDFQLGKLGWYTVQNVSPNDFLNQKLESDQYGIWYSVKFQGDASTFLWQAKKAPEPGERVYGNIEKTASGKSTKFKRAKREDTPADSRPASPGSTSVPHKDTDESIARAVALKAGVEFNAGKSVSPVDVLKDANMFLAWLKQTPISSGSQGDGQPAKIAPEATNEAQNPQPAAQSNPKRPWENRTPAQPSVAPEPEGMYFEGGVYDNEGNLIG